MLQRDVQTRTNIETDSLTSSVVQLSVTCLHLVEVHGLETSVDKGIDRFVGKELVEIIGGVVNTGDRVVAGHAEIHMIGECGPHARKDQDRASDR